MIAEQYERAKRLLLEHKDGHAQLAQLLMEREVIFAEDAERIFGKRQWSSRSEEILDEKEPEKKETPRAPKKKAPEKVSESLAVDATVTLTPAPAFDVERLSLSEPASTSPAEKEPDVEKNKSGDMKKESRAEKKEYGKEDKEESSKDSSDDDSGKPAGPADSQTTFDFF